MADHSHEEVTHLFHVKVPYHLTPQEIEFEAFEGNRVLDSHEMMRELDGYKDDELRRVFKSVTLLLERFPHRQLREALHTAMVWERG
jgi:hypothetical protein